MTGDDELRASEALTAGEEGKLLSRRELLARAAATGAVLALPGAVTGSALGAAAAGPRKGGLMRIGVAFGAASIGDPAVSPPGQEDTIRNRNVFALLFRYAPTGHLYGWLAESAEANKNASAWTIKLRQGVTWQDGSPFVADDVIYSINRILDPKTNAEGAGPLSMINAKTLTKVDTHTLSFALKYPYSGIPDQFATKGCGIVKNGTTNFSFSSLNGTGPFKLKSENANLVVMVRNPNYFMSGLPYLDEVHMINIQDPTARLNALQSGEIDAVYPSDPSSVAIAKQDSKLQVVSHPTATIMPLVVRVQDPVASNNARLAMKYLVDRNQIDELTYGGFGTIGNDMFGLLDPDYPRDIPQREHDPERAKALWQKAGLGKVEVDINTSTIWNDQQNMSLLISQQAQQAGMTIGVKTWPVDQYFTKGYGLTPLFNDYWLYRPILDMFLEGFLPAAEDYYAAHWHDAVSVALWKKAAAEPDATARKDTLHELMQRFWDIGPYVIPAFEASTDILSNNVGGLEANKIGGFNAFYLDHFYIKS